MLCGQGNWYGCLIDKCVLKLIVSKLMSSATLQVLQWKLTIFFAVERHWGEIPPIPNLS